MNANPSGSRTPSTGCWGRSEARREFAAATGPSLGLARLDACAGMSGRARRAGGWLERRVAARQDGVSWGPQPEARRPRKGRGPTTSPARRPSSRVTSASFGENVRSGGRGPSTPARRGLAPAREGVDGPRRRLMATGPTRGMSHASSERRATPQLVQPGPDVAPASACAQSRGKGVLAA